MPILRVLVLHIPDHGHQVQFGSMESELEPLNAAAAFRPAGNVLLLTVLGGSGQTLTLKDQEGVIDAVQFGVDNRSFNR